MEGLGSPVEIFSSLVFLFSFSYTISFFEISSASSYALALKSLKFITGDFCYLIILPRIEIAIFTGKIML